MKLNLTLMMTIAWGAGVVAHASIFVMSKVAYVRAHPEIEWYARSRSFQLCNFCFSRLPIWIAAYLVLLGSVIGAKSLLGHLQKQPRES